MDTSKDKQELERLLGEGATPFGDFEVNLYFLEGHVHLLDPEMGATGSFAECFVMLSHRLVKLGEVGISV